MATPSTPQALGRPLGPPGGPADKLAPASRASSPMGKGVGGRAWTCGGQSQRGQEASAAVTATTAAADVRVSGCWAEHVTPTPTLGTLVGTVPIHR